MSQDFNSVQEEGRVMLVTGGAKRMGASIVSILHGKGYRIAIHYNKSKEEALALQTKLNTIREDSVIVIQANLSIDIEKVCKDVVMQAYSKWGRLDVIINNASIFFSKSLEDTTGEVWDEFMNTNAKAPFFLTKAAAPFLRKTHGCVVNIGDSMCHRSYPGHLAYFISKATIMGMTRALACELAPEVRVNCIAPGSVSWPESNFYDDEFKKTLLSGVALGRVGSFEDVVAMVDFLANPNNSNYVTGQIFNVDGGLFGQN
ncbi:3-oxoacyl-[acyl-carrier-protein] reductase FabG-like [Oratosquilla oratoria]|uniref:3-oxoacyl-[acyl-carrier-protein] reductase FabG-like n=1 Tax=Oratosquilla oratoria TaxID=337810 RepID=UPI003F75D19D